MKIFSTKWEPFSAEKKGGNLGKSFKRPKGQFTQAWFPRPEGKKIKLNFSIFKNLKKHFFSWILADFPSNFKSLDLHFKCQATLVGLTFILYVCLCLCLSLSVLSMPVYQLSIFMYVYKSTFDLFVSLSTRLLLCLFECLSVRLCVHLYACVSE